MFKICGVTDSKLSDVSWKQGSITKSKTPCEWGKTCLGRGLHFKKIILRHQWSKMIYTPNSKNNFLWIYQWTFAAYLQILCVPEHSVQSDFILVLWCSLYVDINLDVLWLGINPLSYRHYQILSHDICDFFLTLYCYPLYLFHFR